MQDTTIGVDISKDHFDAHRLPDGGARQFTNTKTGYRAFLNWAGSNIERIVFEPTGPYHRAFEGACAKAGAPLCKVNPKNARRFAEATGTLAKTDRVDALMLARMGQLLEPAIRPVADHKLGALRELHLASRALIKERTRIKNRSKILTVALLKRHHIKRMDQITRELDAVAKAIMALINSDPAMARRFEIFTSIPGVGEITAFALVIDMPELGNLQAKQAAALAGLAPRTRQSGQWRGRASIGGGRAHLRQALYMPALVACRFNHDLKQKYDQLIAVGKPAKVAITAIMRKLIILANTLVKNNRMWQEKYP